MTARIPWILLTIAAWNVLTVAALDRSTTLELPFGKQNRLPSPDGRYILFGREYDKTRNSGPELWIEETRLSKRTRLLELGGTAVAAWSPDGTAFYVNDRWASDSARSYLYDTSTLQRIDLGKIILASDAEANRFANGHAYFEVERWQDSQNVVVRFHGHTDEAPVVCFDLQYEISRTGSVKKRSKQIGAMTNAGCR
jgi:hypothetical protein